MYMYVIFESIRYIFETAIFSVYNKIALRWVPQDLMDGKLPMDQLMAWCRDLIAITYEWMYLKMI